MRSFIFLLGLLIIFPVNALPQESREIKVQVRGFGLTVEEATSNALQAAVQHALGTMITARTAVTNDELIEDRILLVSGGFVKAHEIVGTPIIDKGLVELHLEAIVAKNSLSEALVNLQIGDSNASAASLFTEEAAQAHQQKMRDRQMAAELTALLFRRRLDLLQVFSGEATNYNAVGEEFDSYIRLCTDVLDWQKFRRGCDEILTRYCLTSVTQATETIPLKPEVYTGQFVSFDKSGLSEFEIMELSRKIPVGSKGISLYRLLSHPVQQKAPNSWVLWIQVQSSWKSTLWKGYLMDSDPQSLFPFLSNEYFLKTSITDKVEQLIVEDKPRLTPILTKEITDGERGDIGIFAISSRGEILQSTIGSTAQELEGYTDVGEFWQQNQGIGSPRLNIFLTTNPTIVTPSNGSPEKLFDSAVLDEQVSDEYLNALQSNAILRLLMTARPNSKTNLVPGFRVKRQLPLTNVEFATAGAIGTGIEFDYQTLYRTAQLQEYLQCVVEIITDDGGQVEKLIAIDAEFAENALRRVLSRHGGIKELIARGSKGVDQALLDWRFSHGIESLDFSESDITAAGLKSMTFLANLKKLSLKSVALDEIALGELENLNQVRYLDLSSSELTNTSLQYVLKLSFLNELILDGNHEISNDGIKYLIEMDHLKAMSLRGTRISEKGIERLRARLPNCEIVFSTESAEESTTDDEG